MIKNFLLLSDASMTEKENKGNQHPNLVCLPFYTFISVVITLLALLHTFGVILASMQRLCINDGVYFYNPYHQRLRRICKQDHIQNQIV